MRRRLWAIVTALSLGAMVAAGCFSPRPDRSKFFVLSPATAAANSIAPAGLAASSGPAIGLGPIKLPEYLDRDEVVTRVGPNRLELSGKDLWAEPLADNFKRVIAQDLTQSLGIHSITFYPWFGTTHLDYQVRIDVYSFETDSSANARLVAHWQVLDASGKLLHAADSDLSEPAQPGQPVAATLSRAVNGFARQIASTIQSLSRRRQAGEV
jgi:uncharacterized protein